MVVKIWWRCVSLGEQCSHVHGSSDSITLEDHVLASLQLPPFQNASSAERATMSWLLVEFLQQVVKNLLTQWELRRKTNSSRSMKNPKTLVNRKGKKRGKNRSQILWRISKQQANVSPSSARCQWVDRASACR